MVPECGVILTHMGRADGVGVGDYTSPTGMEDQQGPYVNQSIVIPFGHSTLSRGRLKRELIEGWFDVFKING